MPRSFIKSMAVALSLATALPVATTAPAFADPSRHAESRHYRNDIRKERREFRREVRRDRRDARHERRVERRWHRGRALPSAYRGHVVSDWRSHGLGRPHDGQRWVRVDNEYLLISAATGVIASIIASAR
ncbi:RcnB family protein [Fulvimarina sp. MAC8]|uniref:RcnB family protein n=1 Tax=Fulvimarina sp. MAC8 TaxID=3162874 RepID=UPI0032EEA43B